MTCRIQVRWSDMDALGHVNNARFFTYLEEARMAWLESLQDPWFDDDTGPVVARACCDFREPITRTVPITVSTRAGRVGNTSLTLVSEISDASGERRYATGEVVLVWIDRRSGRSRPLPDAVRHSLGFPG